MKKEHFWGNRGGLLFVIEATAEYLISILVAGSYLATLTSTLGMSDALTGVISAFVSLGCLFQLLSLFYHKKNPKKFLLLFSLINQILFMSLYIIPGVNISSGVKNIMFTVAVLSAYVLYYFAHPKKITWYTSFVDIKNRGSFTANKEMISLVVGILFQFGASSVLDYYKENGRLNIAFVIMLGIIAVLTIIHSLSILLAPDKELPIKEKISFFATLKNIFSNKSLLKIFLVFIGYYVATYITTPFMAVYEINQLGFSLTLISLFGILSNFTRILFSRFWGKFADKYSFITMFKWTLAVKGAAFLVFAFTTPKTAYVTVALYSILAGISMGGINNAITNTVFVYADPEIASDSLAVCQAISGTVGFLTTLAISPFVDYVQKSGNQLFGIPIYAQQVTSIFTVIIVISIIVFIKSSIEGKEK